MDNEIHTQEYVAKVLSFLTEKYNSIDEYFYCEDSEWDWYYELLYKIKSGRHAALKLVSDYARSDNILERYFAISLAGILMNPVEEDEKEEAKTLISLLGDVYEHEKVVGLLEAIGVALGYAYMDETKQTLLQLTLSKDDNVRLAATMSLGSIALDEEEDEEVIARMHQLTKDPDPKISDWAHFHIQALKELT